MIDVNALRTFLVQAPRPARILITSGDGGQQEVMPPKGVGGVTWAGVARSIAALDPATVELFNKEDQLIRAQRFDATTSQDTAEIPAILARDTESARIALFAQLIAGAYKFSVETAFTKFVEMFERIDRRQELMENRLERTESTYRRVMQERIDEALEEAEDVAKAAEEQKADPLPAIVQTFMSGVQGGAASAGNGKARK